MHTTTNIAQCHNTKAHTVQIIPKNWAVLQHLKRPDMNMEAFISNSSRRGLHLPNFTNSLTEFENLDRQQLEAGLDFKQVINSMASTKPYLYQGAPLPEHFGLHKFLEQPNSRLGMLVTQVFINIMFISVLGLACIKWRNIAPLFGAGLMKQIPQTQAEPDFTNLWRMQEPPTTLSKSSFDRATDPLEIAVIILTSTVMAILLGKAAIKIYTALCKSNWYRQCLVTLGRWPGEKAKTYIYLRVKNQATSVIIKIMTLPHDMKSIRLIRVPRPSDLKSKRSWCTQFFKMNWAGNLLLHIEGELRVVILPVWIPLPWFSRQQALRAAVKPCDVLILFNTHNDSELKPLDLDQEGTEFSRIPPLMTAASNMANLGCSILPEEIIPLETEPLCRRQPVHTCRLDLTIVPNQSPPSTPRSDSLTETALTLDNQAPMSITKTLT